MTFDSNQAWKRAVRRISANRETTLTIAGVFFFLPQLMLALFFPQPEPTAAMSEQQVYALVTDYYVSALPAMIPAVLCQALGTLALLALVSQRARPTVGEALGQGLRGIGPYLLAQVIFGVAIGVIGGLVLLIFAMGGTAGIAVGLALVLMAVIYAGVRVSLTAPLIAVEGGRNPVAALIRSWQLTQGNAWRILAFYALFVIASLIIIMIASLVIGIPLQLVANAELSAVVMGVVSAALSAVMALFFVALVGSVYRQLAGDPADTAITFH